MLCSQFLASCLQVSHPSFPIVTADSGPRTVKQTLQRRYTSEVARYTGGATQIADAAIARQLIHRAAVRESIEARGNNRILGIPAPAIDPTEKELPRQTRRLLAQMRSGFSITLNDYRHRIGQSNTSICPCCRQDEHTVLRTPDRVLRTPDHSTTNGFVASPSRCGGVPEEPSFH